MPGPNRDWHIGDRGPGPTSWSEKGPHPRAHAFLGAAPMPVGRIDFKPSQGRDPHDKVTWELPLEVPRTVFEVECELAQVMDALPTERLLNAAKLAEDEGRDTASWMFLMEREVRR